MPTLDEIKAKNEEIKACKHENWEEYIPKRADLVVLPGEHNPTGRCTGCGKTCVEVYPSATPKTCEVCLYYQAVR